MAKSLGRGGGGGGGGGDICVLPIKGSHMRNGEGRGGGGVGGVGGSRVLQVKCRLRREEGSRYYRYMYNSYPPARPQAFLPSSCHNH